MTRPLYLNDSYLRECEATVTSLNGRELSLDQTIFYPRGGGQPSDSGKIILFSGPEFRVVEVLKKDGAIIHMLENGDPKSETANMQLKPGDRVRCVLDWERRYKLMRMHTAAHVLAAIMNRELNVLITGNQLEVDRSRFDFNMAEFDRTKFDVVVEKANAALSQDADLKVYTLPREEAMRIPGVVKLAAAFPPSISELRIVEIPGIDVQADGGTHVKNLKEVGHIQILKLENKGKDNRRIYFTLM